MKIRVMIVDGIIDDVLCDEEGSSTQVDIVDFDSEMDNEDALIAQYKDDNMHSIPFNIIHP